MKTLVTLLCIYATTSLSAITQLGVAREWLVHDYLPSLQGRVLFVGVGVYTQSYYLLVHNPDLFETIDFVEEKALYGSPYGHHVEEFVHFDPGYLYDHICLFGVMGHPAYTPTSLYSLVEEESIDQAISHAHRLLKIGGTLQLGPSHITHPNQGKIFWLRKFNMPLLKQSYKLLFLGVGSDNIIWWGEKHFVQDTK